MTVRAYYGDSSYEYGNANRVLGPTSAYFNMVWLFEVAWLGEMDFLGDNEASRMIDAYCRSGRDQFVNYDGGGLSRYSPGRMVVRLTNDDLKYDPNNVNSVLAGYILPGKSCQLSVLLPAEYIIDENGDYMVDENGDYFITGNERKDIFAGVLTDVNAISDEQTREQYVDISAEDGWGWLQERRAILPAVTLANVSAAIQSVLEEIDWPEHWGHDLDDASRTLPYFWNSQDDSRVLIHKIAEAQGGLVYIDGSGKLHHRARTDAPASVKTFQKSDLLANIKNTNPWDTYYNYALVIVHPFTTGGPNYLWVTGYDVDAKSLTIGYLETLEFEGDYSIITGGVPGTSRPLMVGIDPIALWDVRTTDSGAGTILNSYIDLELFEDGGDHFRARIKSYYPGTAHIRQFYIQGSWVEAINDIAFPDDRSNGLMIKRFIGDSQFLLETNEAQSIVAYLADLVTRSGPFPTFEIEQRPSLQYLGVANRITLGWTVAPYFRVRAIEHRFVVENGQVVRSTVYTEPYVAASA